MAPIMVRRRRRNGYTVLAVLAVLLLLSNPAAGEVDAQQELPHRWKSYLPSHAQPPSDGTRQTHVSSHVKGPGACRHAQVAAQLKNAAVPRRTYPDAYDVEDDDEDETSDADEERHLRAYLRYKAQRQGRKVMQAADDGIAQLVTPNTSASAQSSSTDVQSNSIVTAVTSLFRLIGTLARLAWLSIKHAARWTVHVVRLTWHAITYVSRVVWSVFLTVWAAMKYTTRQVFRPIRVAAAPIIYIYIGTKWVFWDVPMHYMTLVLREMYPLYVFTGAGLALGTAIGIASSVVLWVGTHVFAGSSTFESSMSKWGSNEVLEWGRRGSAMGPAKMTTVRESLERTDLPDYLRGLGAEWRPLPRDELQRRKSAGGVSPSGIRKTKKSKGKDKATTTTTKKVPMPPIVKSPEAEDDLHLHSQVLPGEDYFSVPPNPRRSSGPRNHQQYYSQSQMLHPRSLPTSTASTPSPTLFRSSSTEPLGARGNSTYPPLSAPSSAASSPEWRLSGLGSNNTPERSVSGGGNMQGPIGATGRKSRRRHQHREEEEEGGGSSTSTSVTPSPSSSLDPPAIRHRFYHYANRPPPPSLSQSLLLADHPAAGGFSSHQLHTIAAGGSDVASSAPSSSASSIDEDASLSE